MTMKPPARPELALGPRPCRKRHRRGATPKATIGVQRKKIERRTGTRRMASEAVLAFPRHNAPPLT